MPQRKVGMTGLEPMTFRVSDGNSTSHASRSRTAFAKVSVFRASTIQTLWLIAPTELHPYKVDRAGVEPAPPGLQPGASTELASDPKLEQFLLDVALLVKLLLVRAQQQFSSKVAQKAICQASDRWL